MLLSVFFSLIFLHVHVFGAFSCFRCWSLSSFQQLYKLLASFIYSNASWSKTSSCVWSVDVLFSAFFSSSKRLFTAFFQLKKHHNFLCMSILKLHPSLHRKHSHSSPQWSHTGMFAGTMFGGCSTYHSRLIGLWLMAFSVQSKTRHLVLSHRAHDNPSRKPTLRRLHPSQPRCITPDPNTSH